MSVIKQEAINCISMLPDTANWEEIFYSLYVIQKIKKGRQEAHEGKGISIKEARERLETL